MIIKNISGEFLPLYTHEFQIDEEFETTENWYVYPVIDALLHGKIQIIGGNSIEEQIDILRGEIVAIKALPPFGNKVGYNFAGEGKKFTIPNGTHELIYTIPSGQYDFVGIKIFHGNHLGDIANLQVRDSINGDYSTIPNYILNQFATNWNVNRETCGEIMPYTARLYTGMQLVVVYTNSLEIDQDIFINYYLHKIV